MVEIIYEFLETRATGRKARLSNVTYQINLPKMDNLIYNSGRKTGSTKLNIGLNNRYFLLIPLNKE